LKIKRGVGNLMNKLILFAIVLCCGLLGGVAQVLFKKATESFKLNIIALLQNYWLIAGFVLYGMAFVGYLLALRYGDVSMLYPLIASSYIFVCILSWIFLKESITFLKVLGNIGIIVSVYLIVR